MATDTTEQKGALIPWRARASYKPGKTRKARKQQYRQQMNMLMTVLAVTVVAAGIVVLINYSGAGAAKLVSCEEFPMFCVPFAGGSENFAALEAEGARELDEDSHGVEGVVRGIGEGEIPFVGNPDAPIHFLTVSNFACSHCQAFHRGNLERYVDEYALEGQGSFSFVLSSGMHPAVTTANHAALCAAEQGAFWEMSDELFRLGNTQGPDSAFSLSTILDSAQDMGLDDGALEDCILDRRYTSVLDQHNLFINDNGVTGTPTIFVRYGDGAWQRANIGYDNYGAFESLTQAANRQ